MFRAAMVVALASGLVLVACGDDDGNAEATPTETSAAVATATEPAATPADGTPPADGEPTPDSAAAEQAAIDALATWLGPVADPSAITVVSVEAMTWPDGCLGLDYGNEACTEALVEGFRVELGLGDATYEARTDAAGAVTRWAPGTEILVRFESAVTNLATFTTDDGGTLEAQPVPGTVYGVELSALSPTNPVGVGLADAPQRDGFLLVYVDPAPGAG